MTPAAERIRTSGTASSSPRRRDNVEEALVTRAQAALDQAAALEPARVRQWSQPAVALEPALRAAVDDLLGRMRASGSADPHQDPALLGHVVAELQSAFLDLREHRVNERIRAQERVREGLDRLRSVADPAQLLERVSRELCASCGFERGVLSKVDGQEWVLQGAHFLDNERWASEFVTFGAECPPRLTHMMLESEMVRRRAPTIVSDAYTDDRTFKPFVEHSRARCYVGAPIMPRGKVIGFFHADHHFSGLPVDRTDLEKLWAFAEGFAHVYERAVLLQRLGQQRDRVKDVLSSTSAVMDELGEDEVWHGRRDRATRRADPSGDGAHVPWTLTEREVDVLRLLAAGSTNAEIARELFIAEGTVKSHVKRILRKLRASNRAEAVSRFLRHEIANRTQ